MPSGAASFSGASQQTPTMPTPAIEMQEQAPRRATTPRKSAPKQAAHNGNGKSARKAATRSAAGTISRSNGHAAFRAQIAQMREEACARYRVLTQAAAPIRVMARMVRELEDACHELGIPAEVMGEEIINRTIGDVDLRRVSAKDDGPQFVSLADDMGLALPGELIDGQRATGKTYRWIHEQMLAFERQLLARRWDLRMYDIAAVGNPLLREMLSAYAEREWGFTVPPAQIFLSLGALDGLDKFFRGWSTTLRNAGERDIAVIFPAPGFNVPEWQVMSLGMRLHRMTTRVEDNFKIAPRMLAQALDEAPDIRAIYLTVSNNPTAFSYTPAELRALCDVLLACEREVLIVADLAYIGTGAPEEDRARMGELRRPGVYERTVFVSSFSKTHTVTGDRCGWVGFGDPQVAASATAAWSNCNAALPADWQLRYMANVKLFTERPELGKRIRALYTHRRKRLVKQLRALDAEYGLFAQVNLDDGGTVYNWSQLRPGEDVFTLFGQTGIAGVPGSAFAYTDDFVRLSVGCIPVPSR
jgi:aspartate/methionine/tyrosine aminotransferase